MMAASPARHAAPSPARSEDAYVDDLLSGRRARPTVTPCFSPPSWRGAFLDVNREPWELDPAMFEDELPAFARARTARVAAGLGAIARIVCEGQEIYSRKLAFAEAGDAGAPVAPALANRRAQCPGLIAETKADHGLAVLIDWHSMPAAAARGRTGEPCDMVLGDRFGAACSAGDRPAWWSAS